LIRVGSGLVRRALGNLEHADRLQGLFAAYREHLTRTARGNAAYDGSSRLTGQALVHR
jgi:hypothetical protein